MNLFARGAFVMAVILLAVMVIFGEASDSEESLGGKGDGIFRDCSDFPIREMNMDGFASVLQPIACNESVVIHVENKLVFDAVHLDLTNVYFVVHSGGTLTLEAAKSINLKRNDSSTKPLLQVNGGEVTLEAKGWISEYANGTTEDSGGVVSMEQGGSIAVHKKSVAAFTNDSIMVVHRIGAPLGVQVPLEEVMEEKTELYARRMRYQEYLRSTTDGSTAHASRAQSDSIRIPTRNSPWVKRPPGAQHRKSELSVDRVLLGKLTTDNDLVAIWGDYDGSIAYGSRPHTMVDGEPGHFTRESVLIKPRSSKQDLVFRARAILRKMEAEDEGAQNGTSTSWTEDEVKMAKTAKDHLGRVDVVLSKRACLTVTMDGVCVLERSGRFQREWMNRIPWRWAESDTYALRATEDGLEVVDGERRVWGIRKGKAG